MTPTGPTRWTTQDDARAVLRKRWDSGATARDHAAGVAVTPVSVPLRAPTAREFGDDFGGVQAWASAWDDAQRRGWRVERRAVGGRLVGANQVPVRAWVDGDDTLWRLIGVSREVRVLDDVLALARRDLPEVGAWVESHPLRAIALAGERPGGRVGDRIGDRAGDDAAERTGEWVGLLAVARWLADRVGTPTFVREIDVPGVDTKFVERHRQVLCALVDHLLPADALDTSFGSNQLARRLRLAVKPAYLRMRHLEPGRTVVGPLTEITARVEELEGVRPDDVSSVVVLENETTYLALPPASGTIAVLGGGYQAERLGDLPWLRDLDVLYWGDLDTHGFAILDRVRRTLPQARSMLMDRDTLLTYRDRWVSEPSPVNAVLPNLTGAEAEVYADLVEDTYGPAVRLEQERIPLARLVGQW